VTRGAGGAPETRHPEATLFPPSPQVDPRSVPFQSPWLPDQIMFASALESS
jgi:hypothetical protein